MGWSDCGTDDLGRPIGYAHQAICDDPDCQTKIDRGLAYACGDMHGGGDNGCGRYFCVEHLTVAPQLCFPCADRYFEDHPYESNARSLITDQDLLTAIDARLHCQHENQSIVYAHAFVMLESEETVTICARCAYDLILFSGNCERKRFDAARNVLIPSAKS